MVVIWNNTGQDPTSATDSHYYNNAGVPWFSGYEYGSICGECPSKLGVFVDIETSDNGICWIVNEDILPQIERFVIYKKEPASINYPGDLDFVPYGTIESPFAVGGTTFCYDFTSQTLRAAGDFTVEAYVAAVIDGIENQSETIGNVPMTPTGISTSSVVKEAVKTQHFTLDGRQVIPGTGIYIVRKTFDDGSVTTEKEFIK